MSPSTVELASNRLDDDDLRFVLVTVMILQFVSSNVTSKGRKVLIVGEKERVVLNESGS